MSNVIRHPNTSAAATRMEIRSTLRGRCTPERQAYEAELQAQAVLDGGGSPSAAYDYAMAPFRIAALPAPRAFGWDRGTDGGDTVVFLGPQVFGRRGESRVVTDGGDSAA